LKWYAGVEPNEIGTAVKDGIVILGGWVNSYVKSWEAERGTPNAANRHNTPASQSSMKDAPEATSTATYAVAPCCSLRRSADRD
jgi:hypothetical protein